jgi:ubiquinone/menaquinone biosynthesis C-methylase UbiE
LAIALLRSPTSSKYLFLLFMDQRLAERDQAEVERSAEEARKLVIPPLDRAQVQRYIDPPADSPYPLEYAFHLLGNIRGKTVLDFGCGSGENLLPLVERGARAIGMDISPELIALARQRLTNAGLNATVEVGSAYATGLPDASVDVILSISLIHHLDIPQMLQEMLRILTKNGVVIIKEPVRFSAGYARVRRMLPAQEDISEYEHPLTREELAAVCKPFRSEGLRYFRLPLVPLLMRVMPQAPLWKTDRWVLRQFPWLEQYSTSVVVRLQR